MADFDEREEELTTLSAIYPELSIDPDDQFCATLELAVTPHQPLLVRCIPFASQETNLNATYADKTASIAAYIERDVELSHLPPLSLHITLPDRYPADSPPKVKLSTQHDWLPNGKLVELEREAHMLWEEYGRCQILFAYIDYLQQAAERGFDLDQSADGCLVLPVSAENKLVEFDSDTRESTFNAGTYDCGICLEPKKGSSCYQLKKCGHVFCRQCLQDFFNNAISEGDVAGVKCLSPDCGKDNATASGRERKRKAERTLHPRELLAMGIEESMVRRYVEMKRKKKLEADKNTVYCPRSWCQSPARSGKYPSIPADLSTYAGTESSSEDESDHEDAQQDDNSPHSPRQKKKEVPPDPADRLAICEKCEMAFCRVCYMGWHGPFARCFPRDPSELSAEEKASYDYIRLHTSPCPTCSSPVQKTHGCNHMKCFQCNTHFCYLCGYWLDGQNPYQHFNKPGSECYQRLWELEEGDEGQGPADGRGFGGGRHWERIALEAARDAEAQEAAAAAQAEEDEFAAGMVEDVPGAPFAANGPPLVVAMAQVQLNGEDEAGQPVQQRPNGRGGRRQRNPFPAHPPGHGVANAVRNHERNRGAANGRAPRGGDFAGGRRAAVNDDERAQAELQRFLEMAQRDEEDGWDSDELGDDDENFIIR